MSTFQKLRKEERETRKNLIVNAAMDLFSQKDFHKIGMRDIAKRAGISAAAIYRYYPSRDDVFVEALIRHMKVVEALFEENWRRGIRHWKNWPGEAWTIFWRMNPCSR
jgi:AcrR family transcriptional regulator